MGVINKFYSTFIMIGNESSRNAKRALFKTLLLESKKDGTLNDIKNILHFIYSGRFTFGISEIPEDITPGDRHMELGAFKEVMYSLAERKITGDIAVSTIKKLLNFSRLCDIDIVRWCLAKDPKKGFGIISVNECLDEKIPLFGQQKPLSLNSGKNLQSIDWDIIPGNRRLMVETKYDGNRAYLVCTKGYTPYFLSSNGFEIHSMQSLANHIQEVLDLNNIVLDGELFFNDIESTSSVVRNKEDQGLDTGVCFYCIGGITSDTWIRSFTETTGIKNIEMRGMIESIYLSFKAKHPGKVSAFERHFKLSECTLVEGRNVQILKNELKKSVEAGFEGLVIKDADEVYMRFSENRIGWWKAKYVETYDAVIVDFQEGTGKHKGKLGSFIVEYNGIQSNVGGSFKDPESGESTLSDMLRLEYWLDRHSLVDKTIRVMSYGLTREGKFRHAAFIGFHGGK